MIGDFNMIDETTALGIESDDSQGNPGETCPAVNGTVRRASHCIHNLPH